MKQTLTLCFLFSVFCSLFSCDSESANDCLRTSGNVIKREILDIPTFDKIKIEEGIELILFQSTEQKIEIETGENLMNDVSVEVIDGGLVIKNNISCNWFRNYNPAKAYVTFTDIHRIYSVSQHKIHSNQTLHFDKIELSSGVFGEGVASEFDLDIVCDQININANDVTYIRLSGSSNYMFVGFWAGVPRLEAENFKVNYIDLFQRSSNDMILHPIQEIKGNIYSTGDVIIKNAPPVIEVQDHYSGTLIISE